MRVNESQLISEGWGGAAAPPRRQGMNGLRRALRKTLLCGGLTAAAALVALPVSADTTNTGARTTTLTDNSAGTTITNRARGPLGRSLGDDH